MDEKRQQQDQETEEIKRELDKNKTLNDPGRNVVDYGRSEQAAAEENKGDQSPGGNTGRS